MSNNNPSQLDIMLQREYEAGNYVRFWNLARRWVKRRRKHDDDDSKVTASSVAALLGIITTKNDIGQRQKK